MSSATGAAATRQHPELSCKLLQAIDRVELEVGCGACSAPKPPALPFRYILVVKRRKPMIPLCSPEGGYQPSA